MRNYYKILGLKSGSNLDEVERKYKDLLKEFDPTKQPDELKEFFTSERQRVQEAYNKISLSLNDSNNNNNKIIVGSFIVFFLVFSITYLIFQNKVEKVRASIPTIEKKELDRNEQRKNHWKSKFYSDYPSSKKNSSGSWFKDAGTNSGGQINYSDSELIKDTTVRFFVFSSSIPYNSFNECYWECLYYHALNRSNFLSVKDRFNWDDEIIRKYKITKDEYRKIIDIVKNSSSISQNSSLSSIGFNNGKYFSYFPRHSSPTLKDKECAQCIPNYIETFSMNNTAMNEFESFLTQYLKDKKAIDAANRVVERGYKSEFDKLTSGMSYALKNKVSLEVEAQFISTSKKKDHNYYGTDNGIGDISYSFDEKEYTTLSLEEIVNKVCREYYSDNSLYTGAIPYEYCYGGNPYCSPPSGYEECSFIDIKGPKNSDVIVIIKKNNRVYSHAYIKAGGYYKFKLGNGNFQSFFYYGKGWNPNKYIKNANCGKIIGGFVSNESVSKSEVINLYYSTLSYTLYSVVDGNFIPKSSNKNEVF
jgi:curved DNA-binding protein CbpA